MTQSSSLKLFQDVVSIQMIFQTKSSCLAFSIRSLCKQLEYVNSTTQVDVWWSMKKSWSSLLAQAHTTTKRSSLQRWSSFVNNEKRLIAYDEIFFILVKSCSILVRNSFIENISRLNHNFYLNSDSSNRLDDLWNSSNICEKSFSFRSTRKLFSLYSDFTIIVTKSRQSKWLREKLWQDESYQKIA